MFTCYFHLRRSTKSKSVKKEIELNFLSSLLVVWILVTSLRESKMAQYHAAANPRSKNPIKHTALAAFD